MSNSLQPHGLQHASLPCPPLSPGVCSDSFPLSQWCYLTISSSVPLFYLCLNLSRHQSLFQWVDSSHQVAKLLELQPQHQSFKWIQGGFPLGLSGLISLLSKGLSRVFSNTTLQNYQFFGAQSSIWSNSHIHIRLMEKPQFWPYGPWSAKICLCFLRCCLVLS